MVMINRDKQIGFLLRSRPISLIIRMISNRTEWSTIQGVIVPITKCSLVIGSALAYFLRNYSAVTWVSNYSCPI